MRSAERVEPACILTERPSDADAGAGIDVQAARSTIRGVSTIRSGGLMKRIAFPLLTDSPQGRILKLVPKA
jgi:hypothetical protein